MAAKVFEAYASGKTIDEREQEVLTPEWIIEAVRAAMDGIEVDPCASTAEHNWVGSLYNICLPPRATELQRALKELSIPPKHAKALRYELARYEFGGGLVPDWAPYKIYWNPPYKNLDEWMTKACENGQGKSVGLIPVRTRRKWWWPRCKGAEVVFLAPFAFQGHKNALPEDMCLVARGCKIPDLGARENWRVQC